MKRPKYNNKKTVLDGIKFDSLSESKRYTQLKWMEKAGEIKGLELQPPYPIVIDGFKVCTYKADFKYRDAATDDLVVEDVKSVYTAKLPIYRLKKKLVWAVYKIDVKEVMM